MGCFVGTASGEERRHGRVRGRLRRAGRSAHRERQAPPAGGDLVDRLGRGRERRRNLRRHGPVRPRQTRLPAPVPGLAARHPVTRHLQPRVPAARPGPVPRLLRRLHAPVRRDLPGRGGDRWQDASALVRCRRRRLAFAFGECLGLRAALGPRPTRRGRQIERDHRRAQAAANAGAQRRDRHRGRAQLPTRHRRAGDRPGR